MYQFLIRMLTTNERDFVEYKKNTRSSS